ncbi:MAG: sulfatase [Saprospiraceae bacterium]|nr:sulfatase [Saprospiraceae bacterium]
MQTANFIPAKVFLLVLVLTSACETKRLSRASTHRPPNIVLIFTDDQGYADVGCFGATHYSTPNLDRMAAEGVRFTQFYTAQPVCSAARAALLTGCYPNRIGIHQALMPESKIGLNPEETTLADMLKSAGYRTAIFGKWHLGDDPRFMPLQQGFDEYFGIPYSGDMWPKHPQQGPVFNFRELKLYENETVIDTLEDQSLLTRQITEHAVRFIRENKNRPFFLYVPHPQPHVPLYVSEAFAGKSGAGLYGDVIAELDWSVGEILAELKRQGIDENTLVVFTSDNGPWLAYGNHAGSAKPLREGKGTVWEGGIREPCIMRFPGKIPAGTMVETPLMTIDLFPSIAELCRAKPGDRPIDGKNSWPVITGKTRQSPQEAYFFYYNLNELQGVRYKQWKMYFPHNYPHVETPGHDGQPGKIVRWSVKEIELYNLENDPSETRNVAAEFPEIKAHIEQLAEVMRARLGDAMKGVEGTERRAPGK